MNGEISSGIIFAGVNDYTIDLFEGQYRVPNGMSYNSYVIFDEKIAVMDTVDRNFTHEWLDNIENILQGHKPDYLVVHHMEPDHSANIVNFLNVYPDVKIVGNSKTFTMMNQFFGRDFSSNSICIKDGDTLELGKHTLTFIFAPMVHWPEVMVSYESTDKVLFSADGFGKFGAADTDEPWADEARRYYIGIVGRYGAQVQTLLKKVAALDIKTICPLHGPVLKENIASYIKLYDIWSSYAVETDGILVAYTSIYGNTKKAVELLAEKLRAKGCPEVNVIDLARCDMSEAVAQAFRYGKLVLATTTYNMELFPAMNEFVHKLAERNFCSRTVGLMENGSWAPVAAKIIKDRLAGCRQITFTETSVSIKSAPGAESDGQIERLAEELCRCYASNAVAAADKNNMNALYNIGYGLYVVTSSDGRKDNGLIVNTVTQLTSSPLRVAVGIDKNNYSHHIIKRTGVMNVNCLSVDAPFSIFEQFGFVSGRGRNKFGNMPVKRSDNGLVLLPDYVNSFMSLKVEDYVDLGTHGMFICRITEARVISDKETMSYTYYHNNVKPKPDTKGKKGWVCKICGYIYEGEDLPEDFICPVCRHGAADFERIQ